MDLGNLLLEAIVSLSKNKVRTLLSMLGVVIGVAAVITLVAMAQATKQRVEQEIAQMGDDWMFIRTFGFARSGVRTVDVERKKFQTKVDADAIMEECSAIRAATPSNRITMLVKSAYNNYSTNVTGIYPNFHDIRRWPVDAGRILDDADEAGKKAVCVIGQTAARELFGAMNPVGEEITVRNGKFKVVGLLSFKGKNDNRDNDDVILFPFSTFTTRIAGEEISGTLLAAARAGVPSAIAEDQIRRLLRQRHNLRAEEADDFQIFSLSASAALKEQSSESFQWLLGMIAIVSLAVGGIGIMNIMLVSVTERTREIGLRMAIGATSGGVLMQFLIEAVVLCTLGGLLGMFTGWGFSELLTSWKQYEMDVSYWIAAVAFGFAIVTGVFFGFYPAWRASRLSPIEALRFE